MKPIDKLRAIIAVKSAEPDGFELWRDAPEFDPKSSRNECDRQIRAGHLFKAKINHTHAAYLSTLAARNAFLVRRGVDATAMSKQIVHLARRKPESVKLHKSAMVVYPPGYKLTIHPTPVPRNRAFELPFVHDGIRGL